MAAQFCGRVHSSVVRGPWFKSGCALCKGRPARTCRQTTCKADRVQLRGRSWRVWRASRCDGLSQNWTPWGLNPGPSACGADVMSLHHVRATFSVACPDAVRCAFGRPASACPCTANYTMHDGTCLHCRCSFTSQCMCYLRNLVQPVCVCTRCLSLDKRMAQ